MGFSIAPQARQKRQDEIERILKTFIDDWHSHDDAKIIYAKNNASAEISEIYYATVYGTIKDVYLERDGSINRFKVAAVIEMACMKFLPICIKNHDPVKDEHLVRKANAIFAFHAASHMVFPIEALRRRLPLSTIISGAKKDALVPVVRNRTIYLINLNVINIYSYPTLNSSNFWEAYIVAATL